MSLSSGRSRCYYPSSSLTCWASKDKLTHLKDHCDLKRKSIGDASFAEHWIHGVNDNGVLILRLERINDGR